MTLLELIMATTLMTTMVATVGVVLRTGHMTWQAQQGDAVQIRTAHATLRHIVRRVRQARAVLDLNTASGKLQVLMPSGEELSWRLQGDELSFGIDTNNPMDLLSTGITQLILTGYEADGTTETEILDDIHSIKCQVSVELPRETNATRTVSCRAWLRAW
jgi:hypothetical protein